MGTEIDQMESLHSSSSQQLLSEYQRLWRHLGFSYPAFLRWRSVAGQSRWNLMSVPVNYRDHALLRKESLDRLQIQNEPGHGMVNPEWADQWAEYFQFIGEAAEWSGAGFSTREAYAMKRIGYRKAHRAERMNTIIRLKGWLPVIEDRSDIKVPIQHDLRDVYGDDASAAQAVTALVLNPVFRFNQGQVDAIREHLTTRTSMGVVNLCVEVANLLSRIIDLGWSIPDGDGIFSAMMETANYSYDGTNMIHLMISQCDGDEDRFIKLFDILTGGPSRDKIPFIRANLVKTVYSLNTGVPVDWLDDNLRDEIAAGNIEDSGWVSQGDSDKMWSRTYHHEGDLGRRINDEAARLSQV